MQEKKEQEEKKGLSLSDAVAYLCTILLAVLVATVLYIGFVSINSTTAVAPPHSGLLGLTSNTLVIVTAADINIDPLVDYAQSKNIPVYVYNIDDAPYKLRLGDKNIPLIPPVYRVPSYFCLDANDNIIGYYVTDLNVFATFLSHCKGVSG